MYKLKLTVMKEFFFKEKFMKVISGSPGKHQSLYWHELEHLPSFCRHYHQLFEINTLMYQLYHDNFKNHSNNNPKIKRELR